MLDPIDYWLFHDEYTAIQAALLILNEDPSCIQDSILLQDAQNRPVGFNAVFAGITKAIISKKLKATISHDIGYIQDPNNTSWIERPDNDEDEGYLKDEASNGDCLEVHYKRTPNWTLTTIAVDDLKAWLLSRNFKPAFFFSEETGTPDYLDKNHPRYSDKLAATVKAWLAMEDDQLLKGKTPILAMESFLTNQYKELGLIYKQNNSKSGYKIGDMNKGAINEIAKIANWKDKGGAPSTPTSEPIPPLEDIDNVDDCQF